MENIKFKIHDRISYQIHDRIINRINNQITPQINNQILNNSFEEIYSLTSGQITWEIYDVIQSEIYNLNKLS